MTDLSICLAHPLVESLVLVYGLLQHADVVAHLLNLAAGGPVRHVADVLQAEQINFLTLKAFKDSQSPPSGGRVWREPSRCSSRPDRRQSSSKCYRASQPPL